MRFVKSVHLFLFFISLNTFATEVKVPAFMNGVTPDPKAKKGEFYTYKINGRFEPYLVTPKKTSNESVEDLVNSLYYSYEKNDRNFFFSLFSPDAVASLKALPANEFEGMWKAYSGRKETRIDFYHDHGNGVIIGVRGKGEKNPDLQFARKIGKSWVFDKLKLEENDPKTNNVGLYVTFLPMKQNKASLLTTFKRDDKFKILEAQVSEPYLALVMKTKDRWELVGQIKDNNIEYSAWPDLNQSPGIIKVEVTDFYVPADERAELLVIESSYPITYYPLSLEQTPQFIY